MPAAKTEIKSHDIQSTYSCVKYEREKKTEIHTPHFCHFIRNSKNYLILFMANHERNEFSCFCVVSSLSLFCWFFFFMVCVKFSGEMFASTISLNALFQSDARLKKTRYYSNYRFLHHVMRFIYGFQRVWIYI